MCENFAQNSNNIFDVDVYKSHSKKFYECLNYIIENLEKNLINIREMKEEKYFELSKTEIINSIEKILCTIKKWNQYFNDNDIFNIQKDYKQLESDISELELCLADYDGIFHFDGISYSFYQIGKLLLAIFEAKNKKGND